MNIFSNNPTVAKHGLTPSDVSVMLSWARKNFDTLPLTIQTKWKEYRKFPAHNGKILVGRLLRFDDGGWNEELHSVRIEASQKFWSFIHNAMVPTCVIGMDEDFILVTSESVLPLESHVCFGWSPEWMNRYAGIGDGKKFASMKPTRMLYNWCNPDYDNNDKPLSYEPVDARAIMPLLTTESRITSRKVAECVEFAVSSWGRNLTDMKLRVSDEGVLCSELSPLTVRIGQGAGCWRFHPSEIDTTIKEWKGLLAEMKL